MRSSARHWASLGEQTFAGGLLLLYQVHRLVGRLPFMLLLVPVVSWYWLVNRRARQASLQFLGRVAACQGQPAPGLRQSWRHLLSFGRTLLDKLLASSGRYALDSVQAEGAEAVVEHLRQGHGALLVTAHMGCLELCQACAEVRDDLRLTVLVDTRHAAEFNRVLRRLQPTSRIDLMQVSEIGPATAVLLAQRIERGELVAIAGDRVPLNATSANTVQWPFLGRSAPFPIGPCVLAMLLRCPVFYMSCLREGKGHRLRFELLAQRVELPRAQRNAALQAHVARFAQALERDALQAPLEWFNFFDFWGQPVASPRRTGS